MNSLSRVSSAGPCLVGGRLGGEGDPSPHRVHQHGGGETRGDAQGGGMNLPGEGRPLFRA